MSEGVNCEDDPRLFLLAHLPSTLDRDKVNDVKQ